MSLEDKWKKAEENLKKFNESMELIKQFPTKITEQIKSLPYTIEGPILYNSYPSM